MRTRPIVSIIITSYNQKQYLQEAIDSVLGQTFQDLEIVVVDDASNDGSREIIEESVRAHPGLVRSLLLTRNGGVAAARNAGLEACRGEWITHLDGDDRYLPHKLEREMEQVSRHGNRGVAYSNYFWTDEAGICTGVWAEQGDVLPQNDVLEAFFTSGFQKGNFPRSPLFRRDSLTGEFNRAGLPVYEDLDCMMRLAASNEFWVCPEPASEYRRHNAGLSAARAEVYFACAAQIWKLNAPLLERLGGLAKNRATASFRTFVGQFAMIAALQHLTEGRRVAALNYWLCATWWNRRLAHLQIPVKALLPGLTRQKTGGAS